MFEAMHVRLADQHEREAQARLAQQTRDDERREQEATGLAGRIGDKKQMTCCRPLLGGC